MYSTCRAISLIRLANVPEPEPGGESRTRMRKPSEFSSMYRSSKIAAASNFSLVSSPSSSVVAMVRKRSTSRSTTTAYSPSFPPKCSYTTGLDTPARAATSSMEVPSRPRSAKSLRPMSSSCSLRSFPDSRASSGQRTSYAQPSFSASQMPRAAMSIWPLSAPCRAQVGSAWCRLCQDSPKDRIASQETFLDLSLTSNSSLPKVWQIELIDQVTWCRKLTRTRLAQKNAVTAPCQDIDQTPPIRAGASRDAVTSHGNHREILATSESASQSGQNFSGEVTSPSNSSRCARRPGPC